MIYNNLRSVLLWLDSEIERRKRLGGRVRSRYARLIIVSDHHFIRDCRITRTDL
jgi:hypothetical protein